MTATIGRILLATFVVVAFVGAVGLASADMDTADAGDRIGEMMPNDHGEHHSGEHNHGEHHNGEHNPGEHHDGESHC